MSAKGIKKKRIDLDLRKEPKPDLRKEPKPDLRDSAPAERYPGEMGGRPLNNRIERAKELGRAILKDPLRYAKMWRESKEEGSLHLLRSYQVYLDLLGFAGLSAGRRVHVKAEGCRLLSDEIRREVDDPAFIPYAAGYGEVTRREDERGDDPSALDIGREEEAAL